jgi:hypothetical protein
MSFSSRILPMSRVLLIGWSIGGIAWIINSNQYWITDVADKDVPFWPRRFFSTLFGGPIYWAFCIVYIFIDKPFQD